MSIAPKLEKNVSETDLSDVESFFIRPATVEDEKLIFHLRLRANVLWWETFTNPENDNYLAEIESSQRNPETEVCLVAIRTSDARALEEWNEIDPAKHPQSGYGLSHWYVHREEDSTTDRPPFPRPFHVPQEALTNGPILGYISVKPFTGDRAQFKQAAKVTFTVVMELGGERSVVPESLMWNVAAQLFRDANARISSRKNDYTSLVVELPWTTDPDCPTIEDGKDVLYEPFLEQAGFELKGRLSNVCKREAREEGDMRNLGVSYFQRLTFRTEAASKH